MQKVKEDKIGLLIDRLEAEKHKQQLVQMKLDEGRALRDIAQKNKLKKAYEDMLKFEAMRAKDRAEKSEIKSKIINQKNEAMLNNYKQAEDLRRQH